MEPQSELHRWNSTTELGRIVAERRHAQGLRQEDLAFAAGVSRPMVIAIEQGKATARIDGVLKVLHTLGLECAVVARESEFGVSR